jgi:hypothetical protein
VSVVAENKILHRSSEVPSWFWMAYTGGIQFIGEQFGQLKIFRNLGFAKEDKKALTTDLWQFVGCDLKGEGEESRPTTRRILISLSGMEIGWIQYDVTDGKDLPLDGSAVVGRSRTDELGPRKYHVLILRQRVENKYKRARFGIVQANYISRQRSSVLII